MRQSSGGLGQRAPCRFAAPKNRFCGVDRPPGNNTSARIHCQRFRGNRRRMTTAKKVRCVSADRGCIRQFFPMLPLQTGNLGLGLVVLRPEHPSGVLAVVAQGHRKHYTTGTPAGYRVHLSGNVAKVHPLSSANGRRRRWGTRNDGAMRSDCFSQMECPESQDAQTVMAGSDSESPG